jgi:hypothetical protein
VDPAALMCTRLVCHLHIHEIWTSRRWSQIPNLSSSYLVRRSVAPSPFDPPKIHISCARFYGRFRDLHRRDRCSRTEDLGYVRVPQGEVAFLSGNWRPGKKEPPIAFSAPFLFVPRGVIAVVENNLCGLCVGWEYPVSDPV